MAYILPKLPYPTDALEPFYDKATLEIHHGKHHAAYVEKLNKAVAEMPGLADHTIEELLTDPNAISQKVRRAVINNGGGHANHSLFWQIMGPKKGGQPRGKIAEAINAEFDDFQSFKKQFSGAAADLFGSGWTFLVQKADGHLEIKNLPDQQSPISSGEKPILLLDLWEHAYYLKWQNRRPEWIETFWNLVDWEKVEELYVEEPAWMQENIER
jgi:Fe-Mn family superoxide dismutase